MKKIHLIQYYHDGRWTINTNEIEDFETIEFVADNPDGKIFLGKIKGINKYYMLRGVE